MTMPQYFAKSLVAVFLDTGVLGFATQRPGFRADSDACQKWEKALTAQGIAVLVPEIAAYNDSGLKAPSTPSGGG